MESHRVEAVRFVGLYASFPIEKDLRHAEVLERILGLEETLQFRKIDCGKTLGKTKAAPFRTERLREVLQSIASGEIDYLDLLPYWKNAEWVRSYDVAPSVHWNSSVIEPTDRSVSPIEERFGLSAGTVTITYPISRFAVDAESPFQRRLVQVLKELLVRHNLHYAFIHQGYRPVAPFSIGTDDVFLRTRDRFPLTSFDADLRVADIFFREFVKSAFWANLLNPLHTTRLEGQLQLLKKEPDVTVEDLEGGRAYVQLGTSPLPKDEMSAAALYQRVRKYLKPLLLETPDDVQSLQREVMGPWKPRKPSKEERRRILAAMRGKGNGNSP